MVDGTLNLPNVGAVSPSTPTDPSPVLAQVAFAELPRAALAAIADAALHGGEMALRHFRRGQSTSARSWGKAGGSPVTEADIAVDTFLKARLSALLPAAGWLSEETADDPARLSRPLVWIVDPIDGTRAFMAGHDDWSVSIALMRDNRPIAGVVHAPSHGVTYAAAAGHGATRNGVPIAVSPRDTLDGARTAGPRYTLEALQRRAAGIVPQPRVPSLALRIARIADGTIEAGLVTADARDWDIAAADLVLSEAGGRITGLGGDAPLYNRPMPVHAPLVAAGAALHPALVKAARAIEPEGAFAR